MAGKTSGTRELWRCAWCVAKVVGGCGVLALWVVVGGCGKKEGGGTGSGKEVVERVGGEESGYAEVGGRSVRGALGGAGVSAGAVAGETTGAVAGVSEEPAQEFLPPGFRSWKEFDETYAKFRAERVAVQESLPVNEDGSRVWLGQIVFADEGLDKRIKTYGMAKQLVKGGAECVFMKMDGKRFRFSEAGLGEAIGKVAAKKYVKVFGWLDEQAGRIKVRYIDVAGDKYVWKDGELVRE